VRLLFRGPTLAMVEEVDEVAAGVAKVVANPAH
jgi:hypothetical protein